MGDVPSHLPQPHSYTPIPPHSHTPTLPHECSTEPHKQEDQTDEQRILERGRPLFPTLKGVVHE